MKLLVYVLRIMHIYLTMELLAEKWPCSAICRGWTNFKLDKSEKDNLSWSFGRSYLWEKTTYSMYTMIF